jgi:hypothetical protein
MTLRDQAAIFALGAGLLLASPRAAWPSEPPSADPEQPDLGEVAPPGDDPATERATEPAAPPLEAEDASSRDEAVPTSQPPAPRLDTPPAQTSSDDLLDLKRRERRGKVIMHTGLGLLPGGTATLLFVTLPARLLKQRAIDRAEDDPSLDAQRRWLDRAYRRDLAMQISAGIGLGLVATGASLAVAGAVVRSGARHRMSHADTARLRVAPALGGTGFVLRF